KSLYSAIKKAFNTVTIKETLPQEILQEFKLLPLEQALQIIHYPALDISLDSLIYRTHPAWERLKFDEILAQQLAMQIARDERQKYLSYPIKIIKESFLAKHVLKQFSF